MPLITSHVLSVERQVGAAVQTVATGLAAMIVFPRRFELTEQGERELVRLILDFAPGQQVHIDDALLVTGQRTPWGTVVPTDARTRYKVQAVDAHPGLIPDVQVLAYKLAQ
jgi:hypothetical protein